MLTDLAKLKAQLTEYNNLESAAALLRWDQATYMPPGGSSARGRQLATLERLAHDCIASPELERLLARAESEVRASGQPESDDGALVRVARRDHERAVKVPAEFMAEFANHRAQSYELWTRARPANDFA